MSRRQCDFHPVIHPWAAKLTLTSPLSKITLAHILAGDTCDPISLSNLEAYLAFREQSLENLQFVVWFQDYRKRFLELPASEQATNPPPIHLEFPMPSNDSLSSQQQAQRHRIPDISSSQFSDHILSLPLPSYAPSSSRKESVVVPQHDNLNIPTTPPLVDNSNNTKLLGGARLASQPFKKECMRVISTFLRPGAVKELPLNDDLRFCTIKALAHSTHPDVFLPVYHEMYNTLETISVPGFLAYSSTVINYPRQLFWTAMGAIYTLLGIGISLSLILTLPVPPRSNRAWRLFGSIFIALGVMSFYCAFRGFCCNLHLQNRIQLRIWELQDVDQESRTFWSKLLLDPVGDNDNGNDDEKPTSDNLHEWDPVAADYKVLHDIGADPDPNPTLSPSSSNSYPTHFRSSCLIPLHPARNGFNRPPVFGPNKVVRDPRIKALHRRILIQVLSLGFASAVIFGAVVVAVPSLNG